MLCTYTMYTAPSTPWFFKLQLEFEVGSNF